MRILDKSPHMASLLVKLHDSQTMANVLGTDEENAQAQLMAAITDLFEEDLSPEEQHLVTDVLSDLLRQVETELRHMVAEKLAHMDNVPLHLILHMANDELDMAEPVLKFSKSLSDLDLVYIIKSKGSAYWQCIAARENLDESVVNVLAETGDTDTAIVLSKNDRITLTSYALGVIAEMAKSEGRIAEPFLSRPDVPELVVAELYGFVADHVKAQITKNHPDLVRSGKIKQVNEAVDEVALKMGRTESVAVSESEKHTDTALTIDFEDTKLDILSNSSTDVKPSYYIQRASNHIQEQGRNNIKLMIDVLKRGELGFFVSLFSEYTNLSYDRIVRFIQSDGMKRLAIAARAYGLSRDEYGDIYAAICFIRDDAHPGPQIVTEALSYFDKIDASIARRVVLKSEVKSKL